MQSETSHKGLWKVITKVQRTGYDHTWGGSARDTADAKRQALTAARREWPGFAFAVQSVVQVA